MVVSIYALVYFLPISIALAESFTGMAFFFYLLKRIAVLSGLWQVSSHQGIHLTFRDRFKMFFSAFAPVPSYLNFPIFLYLLVNFVTIIRSQYPLVSIEGFVGKTLQSAFLYFNFVECMNTRKRLKVFYGILFFSCALIGVNGLYQYFTGHGFIHGYPFDGRAPSSFRHPNDFATYLVSLIPIWLFLSMGALFQCRGKSAEPARFIGDKFLLSRKGIIANSFLFVLCLVCLGLTYSRGAWLSFGIVIMGASLLERRLFLINTLVVLLFFYIWYPHLSGIRQVNLVSDYVQQTTPDEKGTIATESSGAMPQGTVSVGTGKHWVDDISGVQQESIKEEVSHFDGPVEDMSFMQKVLRIFRKSGGTSRESYWREALIMIQKYPALGFGVNTYSIVGKGYKVTWGGYPHNCYLQMAVEIGMIGLMSFLWICYVLVFKGLKDVRKVDDFFFRNFSMGALFGFCGFLIHSFFDTAFYSVQLNSFMWICMGMAVSGIKMSVDAPCGHLNRRFQWNLGSKAWRVIILVVLVMGVFLLLNERKKMNPHYGKVFYNLGVECKGKCDLAYQIRNFKKAVYHDPNHVEAWYQLAIAYEKNGDDQAAFETFQKVTSLSDRYYVASFKVGQHYLDQGDYDRAIRSFKQAEYFTVDFSENYYYLGEAYEAKGIYDQARQFYEAAELISPTCLAASVKVGIMDHYLGDDFAAKNQVEKLRESGNNVQADQLSQLLTTGLFSENIVSDQDLGGCFRYPGLNQIPR